MTLSTAVVAEWNNGNDLKSTAIYIKPFFKGIEAKPFLCPCYCTYQHDMQMDFN